MPPCRLSLGHCLPRILLIEQHLPLQIRRLHKIPVDERHPPHTCSHQQAGRRRSRGPYAHHRRMAPAQLLLPSLADPRKQDLPRVPLPVVDRSNFVYSLSVGHPYQCTIR